MDSMDLGGNTSNLSVRGPHTPIRRAPMYHSTIRKTNDPAASMREVIDVVNLKVTTFKLVI